MITSLEDGVKPPVFSSSGVLHYGDNPLKLVLDIDPEIARYYRALTSWYYKLNSTRYKPHISVVRNATPPKMEAWKRYEGEIVGFQYEGWVWDDFTLEKGWAYFWLNVYCKRLEEIRVELGLPLYGDVSESPDKRHRFHSTIGNTKELK